MAGDLTGKVALVTGGTSGIGAAIVSRLATAGADVAFTGRDLARGEAVAAATGARFIPADSTDEQSLRDAVDGAVDGAAADRLDILVNNAGNAGPMAALEAMAIADFDATLSVHLRGALIAMQAAVPWMRKAGGGSMVNISSVVAQRVGGHSPAYAVAKAGLSHLTRWAAMEFGRDGIRVNTVSPGFVPTPIHGRSVGREGARADRVAEALIPAFTAMQALPQTGAVTDVADAVAYLAGPQAAFVTGADLVIDGGLSLGRKGLIRPVSDSAVLG